MGGRNMSVYVDDAFIEAKVLERLDFDTIWDRYYETANRRFESGLTYNGLWWIVFGEDKE